MVLLRVNSVYYTIRLYTLTDALTDEGAAETMTSINLRHKRPNGKT